MTVEDGSEPLLIKHAKGQQLLSCSASHYWALVRAGKITVVGQGKASRGYLPSIRAYVKELVAEAHAGGKAA
jgi:hypothetical protein